MSERNPRISQALTPPVVAHPTGGRTAVAEGLADITQQAVELRVDGLTGQLTGALEQETADTIAQMQADMLHDPMAGLPDGERSTVQNFVEIQNRLMAASEQHPDRVSELKMRQERILRDYMRRYPKLTSHFQSAAQGVLGYSPIGAELAALQASAQSQKTMQQEWLEQVIAAGTKLGVPASLRLSHPEVYYDMIVQAEVDQFQLMNSQRQLQMLETQGTKRSIQGKRMLRKDMPAAMNAAVPDVLEAVNVFRQEAARGNFDIHRMTPEQLRREIESGDLMDAHAALMQTKEDMITNVMNTYFRDSDMTREDVEREMRPLLVMFDYALDNLTEADMAERLRRLVDTRRHHLDLELPDALPQLRLLGEYTEFAQTFETRAIQEAMNKRAIPIIERILLNMGGANTGDGGPPPAFIVNPDGTVSVNPDAGDSRFPLPTEISREEGKEAFRDLSSTTRSLVRDSLAKAPQEQDPALRAAMLLNAGNMAVQYANAHRVQFERYNQFLDKADVYEWIDLIGRPEARLIWDTYHEIGASEGPAIVGASIERMMATEAAKAFTEAEQFIGTRMGITHRPIAGDDTSLFNLITVEWDSAARKPRFVLDEEAWEKLNTYGRQSDGSQLPPDAGRIMRTFDWINRATGGGTVPRLKIKNDMARAVEELNNSGDMRYFAMLVRANANLHPRDEEGRTVSPQDIARRMAGEYKR